MSRFSGALGEHLKIQNLKTENKQIVIFIGRRFVLRFWRTLESYKNKKSGSTAQNGTENKPFLKRIACSVLWSKE